MLWSQSGFAESAWDKPTHDQVYKLILDGLDKEIKGLEEEIAAIEEKKNKQVSYLTEEDADTYEYRRSITQGRENQAQRLASRVIFLQQGKYEVLFHQEKKIDSSNVVWQLRKSKNAL